VKGPDRQPGERKLLKGFRFFRNSTRYSSAERDVEAHFVVFLRPHALWLPGREDLTAGVAAQPLQFIDGCGQRGLPYDPDQSLGFLLRVNPAFATSILLSPVAWDHYLVLVIPMYVFLAAQMTADKNRSINRVENHWSYLLGKRLVFGGLLGFILVPYYAATRQARGCLIVVLMSYAGLCLVLREINLYGHAAGQFAERSARRMFSAANSSAR